MKLCRYGAKGAEKPGLVGHDGRIRDLSAVIADIGPAEVTPAGIAKLHGIDSAALPQVEGTPRLGVPVSRIGKFIAIGLNYADHAAEANLPVPSEPVIFSKAISCLNGPNDEVMLPRNSRKSDWEVELGVILGRRCRYVQESQALHHVAGYVLVNDISEREFQKERGTQWDKGKGCDTFGPCGPWLVTAEDIPDPQSLDMFLDVNGGRMQTGNTSNMIFDVKQLIAYVSRFITLEPGDLLITGTPPGVGEGKKPAPIFLRPGDEIRLGIAGLGEQRQNVVAWRNFHAQERL